ncbi:efflux RND transporter periplasmic adaptor subunit [Paraglaciecola sp. 2405UD69-4]|uniref:efflux RND transporter periplasmic adaptor subunit n=1 Tax=Paraglaciecola sp. 2405UD69-4 TaxID=3391836 RepID=UPI0039C98FA2
MKQWIFIGLIILCQSCSESEVVEVKEEPVVVQTFTVVEKPSNDIYEFPAVVSVVKSVELRFEVAGRLIATDLVKGRKVKKGQVLAQIDPVPYERKVKDREARHELAANDLKRIEALYKTGGVSPSAYDNAKTQFETTLLDLNNAKQDLSYTKVTAPFDGFVSDRYVENDSYVQVGVSIATIQDRSSLYFSFDVPERVMTLNKGNRDVVATARIVGIEDQVYPIHYVEHQATPDPVTQTYKVTFGIDNAQETIFNPGSRAMVKIEERGTRGKVIAVPVSAVFGDEKSGFAVWLYDDNSNKVVKKAVTVNGLVGKLALVNSGLQAGDKIVSAGISLMREGLLVREYKAEP